MPLGLWMLLSGPCSLCVCFFTTNRILFLGNSIIPSSLFPPCSTQLDWTRNHSADCAGTVIKKMQESTSGVTATNKSNIYALLTVPNFLYQPALPPQSPVPCWNCPYHHHTIQKPQLCLGCRLQPLHGPLLDDGGHVRVLHVEDPEAGQVHPRVAVWF